MSAADLARRRWCLQAATIAWVSPWVGEAAAAFQAGPAIDTAGRQRMLSQRIVKAYCQIGLEVTADSSRTQLNEAVQRFDAQLTELQRGAPNAEVRKALSKVSSLWLVVRRMALATPSPRSAPALNRRAEDLLRASNDAVLALEAAGGTPQSRLVNISGRQRMLSQRMAKAYMMRAWRIDTPELSGQLDHAANEFTGALAALRSAPENTPEIASELDAVAQQWEWFSGAIKLQGAQSYTLVVAEASEAILVSLERVTGLYAAR